MKRLTKSQATRAKLSATKLFAEVEDYAENADCGDGGQGEACKAGECWHCRSVAIVEHVRKGVPLKFKK